MVRAKLPPRPLCDRRIDVQERAQTSPSSCARAYAATEWGSTTRKRQFALPDAQCKRINHEDCKSATRGIRSNNVRCSATFLSRCAWMSAGSPKGVPNTTIPCLDGGKSVSPDPHHTWALGSAVCAIRSRTSQPAGRIPLLIQTCVLSPWMRIRALENKFRCSEPYT